MKEHRIRHACRLALVSALLPLAVGTSAQSAMHWKGTVSRAPQPLQANTGLPAPIDSSKQVAAGFDVQRFEAVANQHGLTRATLRTFLRDSHNFPEAMQFKVERRHIDDLAAYMITLRKPGYKPEI